MAETKRVWKTLVTRDCTGKLDLRIGINSVAGVAPKRAVVFVNGRNEWVEKYDFLPEILQLQDDTLFLTWDHRGQGQSGGERSNVETYDYYAKDMPLVLKAAAVDRLPYAIVAHSMGALVSLYTYMKGYINPKSIVLCSPLLALPNNGMPSGFIRPTVRMMSLLGLGSMSTLADKHRHRPFKINKLTHDKANYKRIMRSKFRDRGARVEWVRRTFDALDYVYAPGNLKLLKIPIYIQGAGKEQVVDNIGIKNWCLRASHYANTEITATIIPGAKHELLSEIDQYRLPALDNIRKWIGKFL